MEEVEEETKPIKKSLKFISFEFFYVYAAECVRLETLWCVSMRVGDCAIFSALACLFLRSLVNFDIFGSSKRTN